LGGVNLKPGLHPQNDAPNDLTLLGPHGSKYLHFTGTHEEPLEYDIVSIEQNAAPFNTHKCVPFNATNVFMSLRLYAHIVGKPYGETWEKGKLSEDEAI
jgi:hypothetical protein